MKTLRILLEDILGDVGPGNGQTSAEVWARYVDGNGKTTLTTTAGAVVTDAARRVALSAEGVADIEVYTSDDALIDPALHGFGVQVGWDFRVRGAHGRDAQVRGDGTVKVLNASPEVGGVVLFGALSPFVPGPSVPGGGGGGGATGGYLDHGDQSGPVTYSATVGTHALTMTADTAITLTGGADGAAIYVTATGPHVLTVEGMVIPTGRALAIRVRDSWEVYALGGDGDVTPPAAGVLTVSYPGTGSSLVVAGASDAGVGLHAAPYAFRQNGGAWTAWQSSPTYTAFTVSPLTSYTWQHKVRDARGTEAVGEAVTSSTPAASTWTTLFGDSFGGGAGVINGRTVETGTGTWARPSGTNDIAITGAGVAQWNTHGQAADAIVNIVDQARIRWTIDYDLSAHTTPGSQATVGAGAGTNSGTTNQVYVNLACGSSGNNATLSLVDNAAGVWTLTAAAGQALTGRPAVGTMVVDLDGANRVGTVSINGTVVGNITGDTAVTIFTAYLRLQNSTAKVGAVTVERYGI